MDNNSFDYMKHYQFPLLTRFLDRFLARSLALALVACLALSSYAAPAWAARSAMSGNYVEDTSAVVTALRDAISAEEGSTEMKAAQLESRKLINDFAARYRRDRAVNGLPSFLTMQTALNALAGHYSSYPNRPVPEKLKSRLLKEFKRVDISLKRES